MKELKREDICPDCDSKNIKSHCRYQIKAGESRQLSYCKDCKQFFSETKNTVIAGLRTCLSRINQILGVLSDGFGVNATSRHFHVSKNSVYRWQEKLSDLKKTLSLYSLCHQFLQQIIEGDEIYTKVKKTLSLWNQRAGQLF